MQEAYQDFQQEGDGVILSFGMKRVWSDRGFSMILPKSAIAFGQTNTPGLQNCMK